MQIHEALSLARVQIDHSATPALDAELLLAHTIKRDREFLITWPEYDLSDSETAAFSALLEKRKAGHPIAYLLGKQAFWNFDLTVNPDVLIPRPETELLVELTLEQLDDTKHLLADLGTGSGAIATALASERPNCQIVATDLSEAALSVARLNADKLKLNNIDFRQGSWTEALGDLQYDAILANPPYIDPADSHLSQGDVRFEPQQALVADENGLADLQQIIKHARAYLKADGFILLEHGYQQGSSVRQMLEQSGYNAIETHKDLAGHDRASMARR